jgi:hypothetical protein
MVNVVTVVCVAAGQLYAPTDREHMWEFILEQLC